MYCSNFNTVIKHHFFSCCCRNKHLKGASICPLGLLPVHVSFALSLLIKFRRACETISSDAVSTRSWESTYSIQKVLRSWLRSAAHGIFILLPILSSRQSSFKAESIPCNVFPILYYSFAIVVLSNNWMKQLQHNKYMGNSVKYRTSVQNPKYWTKCPNKELRVTKLVPE